MEVANYLNEKTFINFILSLFKIKTYKSFESFEACLELYLSNFD